MAVGRGQAHVGGGERQAHRRCQVLRLFRLRPAHQGHALASGAGHAARPQRGHPRPRSRRGARGRQAASGRGQDQGRLQYCGARPAGRRVARGDRAAGVEGKACAVAGVRSAGATERARRRRGHLRVLEEPDGPAARRAGGPARHHGPRSGIPHRRQSRRRRPDGQAARYGYHLPARAQERLARRASRAGCPMLKAQGRPHQCGQRHRQPRDRQARRRADRQDAPAQAHQGGGVGGRRLRLLGLRIGGEGIPRNSM